MRRLPYSLPHLQLRNLRCYCVADYWCRFCDISALCIPVHLVKSHWQISSDSCFHLLHRNICLLWTLPNPLRLYFAWSNFLGMWWGAHPCLSELICQVAQDLKDSNRYQIVGKCSMEKPLSLTWSRVDNWSLPAFAACTYNTQFQSSYGFVFHVLNSYFLDESFIPTIKFYDILGQITDNDREKHETYAPHCYSERCQFSQFTNSWHMW